MNKCEWHENESPLSPDEVAGCPECGRMIATKTCEGCGEEFYDWDHRGFDDILAGPACTSSGDFCCTYCLPHIERERERAEEEDAEWDPEAEYPYDWDEPVQPPLDDDSPLTEPRTFKRGL